MSICVRASSAQRLWLSATSLVCRCHRPVQLRRVPSTHFSSFDFLSRTSKPASPSTKKPTPSQPAAAPPSRPSVASTGGTTTVVPDSSSPYLQEDATLERIALVGYGADHFQVFNPSSLSRLSTSESASSHRFPSFQEGAEASSVPVTASVVSSVAAPDTRSGVLSRGAFSAPGHNIDVRRSHRPAHRSSQQRTHTHEPALTRYGMSEHSAGSATLLCPSALTHSPLSLVVSCVVSVPVGADRVERCDCGESHHTRPVADQAKSVLHSLLTLSVPLPFGCVAVSLTAHSLTHSLTASTARGCCCGSTLVGTALTDLILFGTGSRIRPLPPSVSSYLQQLGIGYEVLQSNKALATFNLLAEEERLVMAALVPYGEEVDGAKQQQSKEDARPSAALRRQIDEQLAEQG